MCLGIFLLRFTLYWTYCISQTSVTISFPRLGKFPPRISPTIFSGTFSFSSSSETPIIWVWMCLMLSQRSLKLSSFLFTLYSVFCSAVVISTILSSSSLIHSSGSVILLLIPSSVFSISVIVLLITHNEHIDFCVPQFSGSLLNISCIFWTCASLLFLTAWIIFTIITLNIFSGRVILSSSFIWSYGSLHCSFTCNLFHCCLILSNLLSLWSPFFRLQGCGFSFSSLPMVD